MADHDTHDHTGVPGVGGSVATDTIWNAAGDLAIGTGSDTATRLAIGSNATVLTSNGTTATWAAPSSGAAAFQTVPDPTSFNGTDTFDGSSTTPFVDVDAFNTKQVLGNVVNLRTVGASQDDRVRVTPATTRAAAFDVRTQIALNASYWSAQTGDVYLEVLLTTAAPGTLAIARLIPINTHSGTTPFGRMTKIRVGGSAITSVDANIEPSVTHNEAVTLRFVRDGSNVISFYYGIGTKPMSLAPIVTGSMVPFTATVSGTLARIEYSIHTPSGPGGTAAWDAYVSYLTTA